MDKSDYNYDLKQDCHRYLDALWNTRAERRQIYKWLAMKMCIKNKECHISKMSTKQLYRARDILRQEYIKRRKKVKLNAKVP